MDSFCPSTDSERSRRSPQSGRTYDSRKHSINFERFDGLLGEVVNEIELHTELIGVSGWKLIQKSMQPEDVRISDQDIAKAVELWCDCVKNRDLLKRALEEVAQEIRQLWRVSLIKLERARVWLVVAM